MALEKLVTLNEFFVRLTDDGTAVQGVHVADMERILEDGVLLSAKMLPPRAVDANDSTALGPIAQAFNTVALATVDAQAAQITQMTADHAAALKVANDAKDAALAQVDALSARIAELQPPAVNGVPQEVTMRQAQLALLAVKLPDGSSLLDKVDATIAAMTGDAGRAAQIVWSKSADVLRSNPLIAQLQGALGLDDAAIDALFVAAAKL